MKTVNIKIVQSLMNPELLSIRDKDGHATPMKMKLVEEGFQDGEEAVIVDKKTFELLLDIAGWDGHAVHRYWARGNK